MKRVVRILILLLAVPALAGEVVSGEVLVKLKPGSTKDDIAGLERAGDVAQSQRIAELRTGTLMRMRSRSKNTTALVAAMQKHPRVEYAEPNYVLEALSSPNDPSYPELWAMKNALGGGDISAEAAWNVTTGSSSIVVGVVDTGVNYLHPDLAPNMWSNPGGIGNSACGAGTYGFNALTNTCDPMDDHYHGSHVAGTIGAAGNNGDGVAGVNWTTSIMALKFLGADGKGTTAGAISAINFAVQARIAGVNVRVLCNSWGGGGFSKALLEMINQAAEHDILFVAAAGNDSVDNDFSPHYPSSYVTSNMIAVAATTMYDDLAEFSNYGRTTVHLGAPGVGILSTALGTSYATLNGTSMATPHVAGVAALLLARSPSFTTAQVKSTILESADPIPGLQGKTITGARLNAGRALGAPPIPKFTLKVSPEVQMIPRGGTTTYSVTINPINGFNSAVSLFIGGLPAGVTASFSQPSTAKTSMLTITSSNATPFAQTEFTVTGVSGSMTRTSFGALVVSPALTMTEACPSFAHAVSYGAFAAPAAVTIGDFNLDGRPDLAAASMSTNDVMVFPGHDGGVFGAPTRYATGRVPFGIATADLNGDAMPDLVTANSGSTTVSVLLGNGDGTFQAAIEREAGAAPFAVSAGDFNRDGRSDIVVANNASSSVSILLGNGDGTFAPAVQYTASSGPSAVHVADLDNDGDSDLAVAAFNTNKVAVLLNNGSGAFAAPALFGAGSGPSGVTSVDLNRDGAPDLAVSNYSSGDVSILLGNGSGSFGAAVHYGVDSETNAIAAGDFNADGKADVVSANAGVGTMTLLVGLGNGTLERQPFSYVGHVEPSHLAVGDLNGDGRDDAVMSDMALGSVAVLLNNGACAYNCGTFVAGASTAAGTNPDAVAAADFNRDGKADAAIANDGGVAIRLGNGDGTFTAGANVTAGSDPDSLLARDFNRDGKLDLAVANHDSNDVSILLGNGNGTFQTALAYAAGTNPRAIAAGDFDRDGRLDLAVANGGSNNVSILRGNGNGTFATATHFAAGTTPSGVVAGDFNDDGKLDLAISNSGSNDVSLLIGNGEATFQTATTLAAGTSPWSIASADFNADGMADLAVANRGSDDVAIFFGFGGGSFDNPTYRTAGTAPSHVLAGDFNNDGTADLAVANEASNDISLLAGNGRGSFAAAGNISTGTGAMSIAPADFNHDGKTDLAVANSSGTLSMLVNTCPPADLTIAKTHSGDFAQNAKGRTYTITVTNTGGGATNRPVTVTDLLPGSLRATALSGNGWSCNTLALTCTRADVLAAGASYPPITITVNVAADAAATIINQAIVSGGGDTNADNDTASDSTIVSQVTDLAITLTHAGSFTRGATARTYEIVAKNAGGQTTSGTVAVTASIPASLTVTAMNGSGWSCNTGSLTCTRNDALPGNSSYPPIIVTVNVAANAPSEVTSTATISGGGQENVANDVASDLTLIWGEQYCGGFGPAVSYNSGNSPSSIEKGDFNRDGRIDLATTNHYGNNVSIFLGNANGTFAARVMYATNGEGAGDLAIGDVDEDGDLDIVVANRDSHNISVLRGDGTGAFSNALTYGAGTRPSAIVLGEFNNDGLPDVAVSNAYTGELSVLLGRGEGVFASRVAYTGAGVWSLNELAVDDVDGDGRNDIVVATEYGGAWRFAGKGDGTFQQPERILAGNATASVGIADFDRDGKLDLALPNHTDGTVSIHLGAGNGAFKTGVTYKLSFGVGPIRIVDVDGDGNLDLLISSSNAGAVFMLNGNGDGTFDAATSAAASSPGPFVYGDFNTDGRADLALVPSFFGTSSINVIYGGCAELKIAKTHHGNFIAGQNHTYSIVVSNIGKGSSRGLVTVVDELPSALTAVSMTGAGWTCTVGTLTCTRTDSRIAGTSFPAITLTVSVPRTAPTQVVNTARFSGGGDIDPSNNVATDPTTIQHSADLKIMASHVGHFAQGQTGKQYTITVGNVGTLASTGVVTVTDRVPNGITATAMSGDGWQCDLATLKCTREDSLAVDGTWPSITLTVNVAQDAHGSVTNAADVSGGGDTNGNNNYASDWTTIFATPVNVAARAVSASQITVTWNVVAFATHYRVLRSTSANGPYVQVGTPLSNSFIDGSLSQNTTYYYRVQAADPTTLTLESATAFATTPAAAVTITFTDDPLNTGTTAIKAVHITELRAAVNAMRERGSLASFTFTDESLVGVPVKAVHLTELRTALSAARSALGLSPLVYTDPTPSRIMTVHLQELRNGTR